MHCFPRASAVALGVVALGLGLASSARADDPGAATRAARLTFVQGAVTVEPADNTGSAPAQLNQPLVSGLRLTTGDDGQAEVEFEDGSVVRLTPNSLLSLDNLAVEPGGVFTTGMSLLHGLAYVELRATPQYRYTLNAGGDILSPIENTTVRVDFDEPPAIFAVLDGTAQVARQSDANGQPASDGYQTDLRAGESVRGDPADPTRYFLTQEIAQDSWDQWNEDRDQAADAEGDDGTAVRNNYAGAEGYGWSDLDANGSWYDVPGQGPVWQPQAAVDDDAFDPYGNGAWVWYPATGYVWASGYAWGWTPYRCGNWSYFNGFGWGWSPGAGCGGHGWGFTGGGLPVNIGLGPRGYQPVRVPVARRGPQHPLLPVHVASATQPAPPGSIPPGPRKIGGVTVMPIEPVGSRTMPGGRAEGAPLRRDFPIDSATHTPVLGLPSGRTAVPAASGWRSAGGRPATQSMPANGARPATEEPRATAYPAYREPSQPAPVVRAAPSYTAPQRPAQQQSAPVEQRSSPPPPPPPHESHPASAPVPASAPAHTGPR